MSFPRYPAYKHSGIEWLGDVPEHWEVVPVKRCLKSITQGWSPQCENYPAEPGQWGVLKVGCVNGGSFDPSENKALPSSLEPLPDLSIRQGDVLVSRANTRELVGSVAVAERDYEQLMLCDKLYRLRVDEQRCDAAFLAGSLSTPAARGVIEATASGASSSMLNIGQAAITGLFIAVPPLREQQQLVSLVRSEAVKIDSLIEEQRRLIDLLKEKRQASISQAVTKGLNPNAPTKDSGVQWLGKVPAHWTVCALRRVVSNVEQGWSPECDSAPADDQSWGVLKAGCVNRGVFDPAENKSLPDALTPIAEYEVRPGDVLMSRASGSPELVGSAALVGETRGKLMLSDKIFRVHLTPRMMGSFFVWAMNGKALRGQIECALSGGNGLANNLPQSAMLAFLVAVPPVEEQQAISTAIESSVRRCDELVAEADRTVSLLIERRAALITAAATGKIDVRGLVPQPEAVAA